MHIGCLGQKSADFRITNNDPTKSQFPAVGGCCNAGDFPHTGAAPLRNAPVPGGVDSTMRADMHDLMLIVGAVLSVVVIFYSIYHALH
jgi:hypothetical protein